MFFLALGLYPDAMRHLFEFAGETARLDNLVRLELCQKQGLPLSMFNGVDLCDNRGPMASPDLLRRIYFPSLKHSLKPLVDAGVTVIWHSDGNIVPLFQDLIDCGVRGFQGFQEETGVCLADLPKLTLPTGRKPARSSPTTSRIATRRFPRSRSADGNSRARCRAASSRCSRSHAR